MNIKRNRSSNFNKEEELLLLGEINKYKDIIECKITNKLTLNEKDMAWQKVLHAFNAQNFQTRTLVQIKYKYDNLKTKARKEIALFNQTGTDGGPSCFTLDSTTQAILNITNLKSVIVLENNFDSDSKNDIIIDEGSFKIEPLFAEMEYNNDSENNTQIICQDSSNAVLENRDSAEEENFNESLPSDANSIAPTALSKATESTEHGSRNYTPHPQRKRNAKLIRAKEMYYKRKLEIMEDCFQNDNIDRENRNKRKEEEYKKNMILLDLKIEIKKKKLMNT